MTRAERNRAKYAQLLAELRDDPALLTAIHAVLRESGYSTIYQILGAKPVETHPYPRRISEISAQFTLAKMMCFLPHFGLCFPGNRHQ